MVRRPEIADASLAARREARGLGIAMAAIMPMIATTISSSMSEKPFWPLFFCISVTVLLRRKFSSGVKILFLAPSAIVSGYAPVGRLLTPGLQTRFVPQPAHRTFKGIAAVWQENLQPAHAHA